MKNTTSFRLTDEAKSILERKARVLNLNKTEVLESMIQEFSLSTFEERRQQRRNREKALRAFLDTEPKGKYDVAFIRKKAWNDGFTNGWRQFQTRKSTSLFRISKVCKTLLTK